MVLVTRIFISITTAIHQRHSDNAVNIDNADLKVKLLKIAFKIEVERDSESESLGLFSNSFTIKNYHKGYWSLNFGLI